jgi:hypothetical protein
MDAAANQVDASPIWQRIDADDFAAARSLTEETRAANPEWIPPEEMLAVFAGREGQAHFDVAFAAADLALAVDALARPRS